jgi:hypothetical protein
MHAPSGGAGATLWPTYEVRQRWIAAINSAQTYSEVGLALQGFLEQAEAFGVIAADPLKAEKALAPRRARLAVASHAYRVDDSPPDSPVRRSSARSHTSSKSKHVDSGRDRPTRAAARSVKSYAE